MKLERTKNSVNNVIWGIVNKLVTLLGPFVVRTVLIYKLSAEYSGLNSLFSSILQILSLSELGFSSAIVYSMYKPVAEDDEKTISALLNLYRKAYRIIGLVILLIGIVLTPILKYLIKGNVPSDININILFYIFLFNTVISYFLFAYKTSILSAYQREDLVSKNTSVVNGSLYIIQIVVLLIFKNYYFYIIFLPVSTIAINLLNSATVDRLYPQYKPEGEVSAEMKQEIKKQIFGLMISKICGATRNTFDSIVISMELGLTMVTIYNNYFYIINSLVAISTIFLTSITAGVGNKMVTDSEKENYKDFSKFFYIYMWIVIIAASCLASLYQPFMRLWMGEKLMLPMSSVFLFCIYFFHLKLGDINSVYYQAAGLWWTGRYRSLVESVINISLNFILGYFFGVNGIILATLISMWSIFYYGSILVYRGYFKNEKKSDFFIWSLKYIIVCVITVAVCFFITRLIPDGKGIFMGILMLVAKLIVSLVLATLVSFGLLRFDKNYAPTKSFMKRLIKRKK